VLQVEFFSFFSLPKFWKFSRRKIWSEIFVRGIRVVRWDASASRRAAMQIVLFQFLEK